MVFMEDFTVFAGKIRQLVFNMILKAGGGHIAPAMSCAEILAVLYGSVLRVDPENPGLADRDRFILSKGHASAALYAALALKGFFPMEWLDEYCAFHSPLGGHPDMHKVPGVEASTGSLGHGLPFGAGLAYSAKVRGLNYKTWVMLGDGECQEGSVWETALFAAQNKLSNLVVVVDANGFQAMERLEEIITIEPQKEKWESFGWSAREVDGHDVNSIYELFRELTSNQEQPVAIIARTVKGKGISFMENQPLWHYRLPDAAEEKQARQELGLEVLS
jgi:transketolase